MRLVRVRSRENLAAEVPVKFGGEIAERLYWENGNQNLYFLVLWEAYIYIPTNLNLV